MAILGSERDGKCHEPGSSAARPTNVGACLLAFVQRRRLSRAELEVVIADLAAAKRAPGRTRQQGYDDYVSRDGLGMELYRLLLTAPFSVNNRSEERSGSRLAVKSLSIKC